MKTITLSAADLTQIDESSSRGASPSCRPAAGASTPAAGTFGGYGNRNIDNENAARERIWFSPVCRAADEPTLFAEAAP